MSISFRSKHPNTLRLMMAATLIAAPQAYSRTLLPGESEVVTNPPAPEAWVVSQGGTLTIDDSTALTISSQSANVIFNGGQSQRINANTSSLNMSGAEVNSATGRGAIQLIDSRAMIDNSTITSTNSFGLLLGRNISTPASSSATVTGNSVITGAIGGAQAVGFAVLNVADSKIVGTGANSYGVQLGGATLSATDSTITGGKDGLQIVTDTVGISASTVTLHNTRITSGSGSAIVLGSSGNAGTVATIDVSGNSELVGGNGSVLQATNRSTANFNVNGSTLTGDVIAETNSTIALVMQNAATLNGDLQNVTKSLFDSSSTLNGNVLGIAGTATTVGIDNKSTINGNVNNVASLSLNNSSALTGNVTGDANSVVVLNNASAINGNINNIAKLSLDNASALTGDVDSSSNGTVLLNNNSTLTGQINNSGSLNINNAARWVMTGDNTVQRLALDGGIVRMGTNEEFQQLNVGDLSGHGTFVMGTDLGNGNTDFLNVTGNASGQHQLQIAATGTTPVTAEAVKVGNIAAGDASFSLGGRETVDAGAFVYRLKQDGQGLYLNPDRETVSTSTNTALALAGSARSVSNAEMNLLNSQIGDRGLSIRPNAAMRAASESDTTKLSNSVWVRTYGNQYNVKNAYGDGYTQNQTGITGGADTTVNIAGQDAVLGAFVGTSRTDMDLKYGSTATIDSVSIGVYGSTFDPVSGIFINGLLKINQFNNKAKVTMSDGTRSKGDYKALGASGAVTVGKHYRFGGDWFLEPQVGLSTGVTQSDSYRLDNGLEVDADTMRSVQGNIGIRGGRLLTLEGGALLEPSVSLGANHEFVKTNEVKINDDSFDDDRASSTLEYRAGLKWTPAQRNWQVAGEVGGGAGNTVSQDWSASLRVSHFF
ncbi:autotransporter outer membrane beta-barrel domain-containing protein [Pseudomonas atacamensis]|uniref:autotransporter outer membrane beta-barrel domain-containing protein n=1 Tax=Pseudomonas atacamensis TaxID=2565368 RepID=UPI0028B93AE1|nr:autotransporter outer membrane beta-barrel domain-containing protein [Pseudomonas atacamensis]MDT6921941.1 autotransporter outer membrane beta-barrel domain-containing protein [Pseudomonas atacamensis]